MHLSEPCSVFFGVAKSCGSIVAVRVERLPWHYHEVVMLSRLVVEHSEAVKSVPLVLATKHHGSEDTLCFCIVLTWYQHFLKPTTVELEMKCICQRAGSGQ